MHTITHALAHNTAMPSGPGRRSGDADESDLLTEFVEEPKIVEALATALEEYIPSGEP
jgi:hypothetical protein